MTVPTFGNHRTKPPKPPEVFGPYHLYLDSTLWPSIRDGRKELEVVDVTDRNADGTFTMAPQYATGCLHKLVRWARQEPQGEVAGIDDVDLREEHVRMCTLGRHLQARSVGLTEESLHALFGEAGHGPGAEDRDVIAALVVAMGEEYPEWDINDRIKHAFTLYRELDNHFIIRKRERP